MRSIKACLGLSSLILLSSCATTTSNYYTQTVQSWRGGNVTTLITRWGRADSTITAGDGNTLLVYKTEGYRTYNTTASPAVGVNYSGSGKPVIVSTPNTNSSWSRGTMSLTCSVGFEVDKHGTIVDTQVQGPGCYGGENFAAKMGNPNAKVITQGKV